MPDIPSRFEFKTPSGFPDCFGMEAYLFAFTQAG